MRKTCALLALCALASLSGCVQPVSTDNTADVSAYLTTKSLYDWFTENADQISDPWTSKTQTTRVLNEDGSLKEYGVFTYDANGNNTDVKFYSSETLTDSTTLLSDFAYVYTNGDCSSGTLQTMVNGVMTTQKTFTATYNAQHNYTDCLVKDGSGNVLEHRVCSYDAAGLDYVDEKYYSDSGTSNLIESYHCNYDTVDPTKWISEEHYLKLVAASSSETTSSSAAYASYEDYIVHTFTWNGSDMYLQSDFQSDSTWAQGSMISAIMYAFDANDNVVTRSSFNQDLVLMYRRSYEYDSSDRQTAENVYNYNATAGEELDTRYEDNYYSTTSGTSTRYWHDRKTYTFSYGSRALVPLPAPMTKVILPATRHHEGI